MTSSVVTYNFEYGRVLVSEVSARYMEQFLISLHMIPGPPQIQPICLQQKMCQGPYILQNPEQLTRTQWLSNAKRAIEDPNCMEQWDYSKANLQIVTNEIDSKNVSKMKWVPIQFPSNIVQCAKSLYKSKPKLYDFSFFGTVTPRRYDLLKKLENAGLKVFIIQNFGFTQIVEQSCCSRIILNIHAGHDQNIFESVRCGLFLDAGIPVVSEQSLDNDPRVLEQFVPETIVDVCKRSLTMINDS